VDGRAGGSIIQLNKRVINQVAGDGIKDHQLFGGGVDDE
jgi:hypothetical protein